MNTAECEQGAIGAGERMLLQWGRRVNTAEWGGVGASLSIGMGTLQWGRRVNTAEWMTSAAPDS